MKTPHLHAAPRVLPRVTRHASLAAASVFACRAAGVHAQADYKVLDTAQLMGVGGVDYVTANNDARPVFMPFCLREPGAFYSSTTNSRRIRDATNMSLRGVDLF